MRISEWKFAVLFCYNSGRQETVAEAGRKYAVPSVAALIMPGLLNGT
jgi:hypothetical protein